MNIAILEPSWNGLAHCPANLGMLRVLRHAYPEARMTLLAGEAHVQELRNISASLFDGGVQTLAYAPHLDEDTLPADIWHTWRLLQGAPRQALAGADLIVLLSCTASSLWAIHRMGLASRTLAFLHGNANDLLGWRSRNPLRKWLDFSANLQRYAHAGGKVLVYEALIKTRLAEQLPWLQSALHVLGHPLLEEEQTQGGPAGAVSTPVRIGYAGNATIAKGFPEFVKLAEVVSRARPGAFEFHSFSSLHPACQHLDQSALATKAAVGLPRAAFISSLKSMDFIFAWHADAYYGIAASGIMYDAINLGVPLLARRTAQLQYLADQGTPIGLLFDTPQELESQLLSNPKLIAQRDTLLAGLCQARAQHAAPQLAHDLLQLVAA